MARWLLRSAWWLLRLTLRVAWRLILVLVGVAVALAVLPVSRRWAWSVVSWCLRGGRRGTAGTTKLRNYDAAQENPAARLRPSSAQRIVTRNYGPTVFHTHAVSGPGLLTMIVGASGMGKSEWQYALWRSQLDGEPFCGLPTTRPRRILLLSEMGAATLQPGLRRWGFVQDPRGRLDAIRLRLWTPRGSAGAFVDVVHAADVYAPDGDGKATDWPKVVAATRERALRGGYDSVGIDTLGEWMGSDGNDAVLESLGACRQLTREGLAVTVLHHTPRSDPRRPRGGGAVEGLLDIGWAVYGTGERWGKRSLHDPVRVLAPFKSRFQDVTPAEPLTVEYRPGDPATGVLPRYELAGAPTAAPRRATITEVPRRETSVAAPTPAPPTSPGPGTPGRRLLDALRGHGGPATIRELGTTLPRKDAYAAAKELLAAGLIREAGTVPTPGGGPPARRYALITPAAAAPVTVSTNVDIGQAVEAFLHTQAIGGAGDSR